MFYNFAPGGVTYASKNNSKKKMKVFCGVFMGKPPVKTPPAGQTTDFRSFARKGCDDYDLNQVSVSKYNSIIAHLFYFFFVR
jgi:hypothetical protein